jgi:prepilin-type N-terminal cleavage/methylation domain-containing protein
MAGFTMIELMIVVGMMAIVAALAVRVMSRASRGERAPAFARSVLAMAHHARQMAMISNRPARIGVWANGSSTVIQSEVLEADGTTWTKLDGAEPQGHGIEICDSKAGRLTGAWPTSGLNCPTTATSSSPIYIMYGKGQCTGNSSYVNCLQGSTSSGSTIYLQTHDGGHKFRILIWGLTGLPALVDQ